jgi:hypothetical protein
VVGIPGCQPRLAICRVGRGNRSRAAGRRPRVAGGRPHAVGGGSSAVEIGAALCRRPAWAEEAGVGSGWGSGRQRRRPVRLDLFFL